MPAEIYDLLAVYKAFADAVAPAKAELRLEPVAYGGGLVIALYAREGNHHAMNRITMSITPENEAIRWAEHCGREQRKGFDHERKMVGFK